MLGLFSVNILEKFLNICDSLKKHFLFSSSLYCKDTYIIHMQNVCSSNISLISKASDQW